MGMNVCKGEQRARLCVSERLCACAAAAATAVLRLLLYQKLRIFVNFIPIIFFSFHLLIDEMLGNSEQRESIR